jgi:hypothetical protein
VLNICYSYNICLCEQRQKQKSLLNLLPELAIWNCSPVVHAGGEFSGASTEQEKFCPSAQFVFSHQYTGWSDLPFQNNHFSAAYFICIRLRKKTSKNVIFCAEIVTLTLENRYTWYSKFCKKIINRIQMNVTSLYKHYII